MQVSDAGYNLIKKWEALKLTAYKDGGGVWTIGWGATTYESGAAVKAGDKITVARAVQLLNFHAGNAAAAVNSNIKIALAQNQFDALVDFVYNLGAGALAKSDLRVLINTNPDDFDGIAKQFRRWVYDDGKVVQGLVNRRESEIALYTSGAVKKKRRGSGLSLSRRSSS